MEKNTLKDTRCYLIGTMEFADGTEWRTKVKEDLKGRGIKFYDPYHDSFINATPEDKKSREEMLHWRETGQFGLVAQRMKAVRALDLRLCDVCDWFIAVIKPKLASWGSAEELTTVVRQKKPVFLIVDDPQGVKNCPLWLFGVMPYKYFYNSLDEALNTIKAIDDNTVKLSSDRWKLLLPHLR